MRPPAELQGDRALDRAILGLAVPALGALVAEPVFVLVDSAVVGRLGTPQLAGLSLASTVLMTVVGLCIFLAYATTAAVSRRTGAGRRAEALRSGIDGLWLALGLGIALALGLGLAAPAIVTAMGAEADVARHAADYLRWSVPGLPGMLLVLASTGVLRGMLDTRTPLYVAVSGALLNIALSIGLVWGLGLGIAGSGAATSIAQIAMGAVLVAVVVRGARREQVGLLPRGSGIWAAAREGGPLVVRTLSLRLAILLTVWVATGLGAVTLAAHQVVNSVWGLTAFALDALAIAAQALVGHGLGAGDTARVRTVLRRTLRWGLLAGVALGLVVAAASPLLAPLFSQDPAVRRAVVAGLVTTAVLLPLAGWVFVLDGVLIGAGDGRYLAWAGLATLVAYVPCALAVRHLAPTGAWGVVALWVAFGGVFMAARALTTGLRARTTTWMVTGA